MATAVEAQPLITEANCLLCKIPPGAVWYVVLAVIDLINSGDTVPTDPDELMSAARCLQCEVPPGLVPYLILQSLIDFSGGGGGGGTGGVTCSTADPVAAPANSCTLHYRTDTGSLWMWNGAAWVALIV